MKGLSAFGASRMISAAHAGPPKQGGSAIVEGFMRMIAVIVVWLAAPAAAGQLSVGGAFDQSAAQIAWRQPIGGPWYAVAGLGLAHQSVRGGGWSRPVGRHTLTWRQGDGNVRTVSGSLGLGRRWALAGALQGGLEATWSYHWRTAEVAGGMRWDGVPYLEQRYTAVDAQTLALAGYLEWPLTESVALQAGGGYAWDLDPEPLYLGRAASSLSAEAGGPFATLGVTFRLR